MFLKFGLAVLAVIVAFLGYVGLQSPDFTISREISIHAPAEQIFPHLNNSRKMNDWNPWIKLDSQAKVTFSGPDEGVGARTSWEGGSQLGTGSATVTEVVPDQRVKTRLEYTQPFEMTQDSEIAIKPAEYGSVVVWSVSGKNTFIGRLMCLFMNMEKTVGGTFEKGLLDLKGRIEKST